jgi:hypothetical protein
MSDKIGLKVTVEYYCPKMINKEYFIKDYNSNAKELFEDLDEDAASLMQDSKIIKIESYEHD